MEKGIAVFPYVSLQLERLSRVAVLGTPGKKAPKRCLCESTPEDLELAVQILELVPLRHIVVKRLAVARIDHLSSAGVGTHEAIVASFSWEPCLLRVSFSRLSSVGWV